MINLSGLTTVNLELTSRCNKGDGTLGSGCWMCGRRKIERDYPELAKWGDMDYGLVKNLSYQIPNGVVVQFHDNGEPLLYPRLGEALQLFDAKIRCLDTNGKLLVERADEIIDNLDTITISTFIQDDEGLEQYEILKRFLELKGNRKPNVIIRCLGTSSILRYEELGCIIATRILHSPMGSFDYEKPPTIPEIGICLDALNHLVIHRDGGVSMCVRFDPHREGIIGDANTQSLEEIWNGLPRLLALQYHIKGQRDKIPLCRKCEFWGVPTGW